MDIIVNPCGECRAFNETYNRFKFMLLEGNYNGLKGINTVLYMMLNDGSEPPLETDEMLKVCKAQCPPGWISIYDKTALQDSLGVIERTKEKLEEMNQSTRELVLSSLVQYAKTEARRRQTVLMFSSMLGDTLDEFLRKPPEEL